MMQLVLMVLFVSSVWALEFETTFENSNFTLSAPLEGTGERKLYNYNRFRVTGHVREGDWFVTAIGDIENVFGRDTIQSASYRAAAAVRSDTPFSTQTHTYDYDEGQLYAQLYRLYAGVADAKHRVSFGLQKISMGVGRIWNPTDLFNPKNPLALEPDEVYGVFSLAYTYALSDLSQVSAVAAQRADDSFKYAGRFKGYFGFADAAIDLIDADDVNMVGYELEGELLQTGVELRSEGGWFKDKVLKREFFQGLIGADYAFENSLVLAAEWLYSSKTFKPGLMPGTLSGLKDNLVRSQGYAGLSAGYEFDALLSGSLTGVVNADDGSCYLSPLLSYSLGDDLTAGAGAMFYAGESGSEFGDYGQTYYVTLKVTF